MSTTEIVDAWIEELETLAMWKENLEEQIKKMEYKMKEIRDTMKSEGSTLTDNEQLDALDMAVKRLYEQISEIEFEQLDAQHALVECLKEGIFQNRGRVERTYILASLSQEFPNFTQSCQNFIHDLRKFSGDEAARNRLGQTGHAYYLGKPYFEDNIREKILTIPTRNGTLQDDLNLLAAKTGEGEVCAARDLSPLYEAALGFEWDKIRGKGSALHQQMESRPGDARQVAKKIGQFFKSIFGRNGGRRDGTAGADGSESTGL